MPPVHQRGETEEVVLLRHPSEKPKKDQFIVFQQELEQYVIKNFDEAKDIIPLIRDMEDPTRTLILDIPRKTEMTKELGDLEELPAEVQEELLASVSDLYAQSIKIFATRRRKLKENITKVYGIAWGNCSHPLQTEIASMAEYQEKRKSFDAVWLIQNLKLLASGIDKKQDVCFSTFQSLRSLYSLRQQQNEPLEMYLRRFQSIVNTAEMLDAAVILHPGVLTSVHDDTLNDTQNEKIAEERYKAMIFFLCADTKRYSQLWTDLDMALTLGENKYPSTTNNAFEILAKYKPPKLVDTQSNSSLNQSQSDRTQNTSGRTTSSTVVTDASTVPSSAATFAQVDRNNENTTLVPGTNGITNPNVTCWGCHKPGHIITFCPEAGQVQQAQFGEMLSLMHVPNIIPSTWILLDTASAISSIMNPDLVSNVVHTNEVVRAFTNGGHIDYSEKGQLLLFPMTTYFNKDGIANILSMADVSVLYRVTQDTAISDSIFVHIDHDHTVPFKRCSRGL